MAKYTQPGQLTRCKLSWYRPRAGHQGAKPDPDQPLCEIPLFQGMRSCLGCADEERGRLETRGAVPGEEESGMDRCPGRFLPATFLSSFLRRLLQQGSLDPCRFMPPTVQARRESPRSLPQPTVGDGGTQLCAVSSRSARASLLSAEPLLEMIVSLRRTHSSPWPWIGHPPTLDRSTFLPCRLNPPSGVLHLITGLAGHEGWPRARRSIALLPSWCGWGRPKKGKPSGATPPEESTR
jgi:hypothetical protein